MPPTTITLEFPLKRGAATIASIELHKPNAGHLRGISLRALLDMEADAIATIVPRISDPKITPQEMQTQIDPSDLLTMGAALANFCLGPSAVAQAEKSLSPTE